MACVQQALKGNFPFFRMLLAGKKRENVVCGIIRITMKTMTKEEHMTTARIVTMIQKMYDEQENVAPTTCENSVMMTPTQALTVGFAAYGYYVMKGIHDEQGCDVVYGANVFARRVYAKVSELYTETLDVDALAKALNEACIESMC